MVQNLFFFTLEAYLVYKNKEHKTKDINFNVRSYLKYFLKFSIFLHK